MEFPRTVFKVPGPLERGGGTYDALLVGNDDQLGSALGLGWFLTLPEAIAEKDDPKPPIEPDSEEIEDLEPPDEPENLVLQDEVERSVPEIEKAKEDAPPTRSELEAKADELGLKYDKRWSDKGLLSMIERALES